MAFGEIRCTFCHVRLPIGNMYPWVGRVLQCGKCKGMVVVNGHYLEYNGKMTLSVRRLTPWEVQKVNKAMEHETT